MRNKKTINPAKVIPTIFSDSVMNSKKMLAHKNQFLLRTLSAMVSVTILACGSPKEREAFLPADQAGKVIAIADIKDIAGEKNAAFHVQDDALKKELASRETIESVPLSEKLKALASKVEDEKVKATLEKATFAFSLQGSELHVFKVETEATLPVADVSKFSLVKQLQLKKAIIDNKDYNKHLALTKQLADLMASGATSQQKQARLVLINKFTVAKKGILANNKTDFGEKKSSLGVQESADDVATHIEIGDPVKEEKPAAPADGAATAAAGATTPAPSAAAAAPPAAK